MTRSIKEVIKISAATADEIISNDEVQSTQFEL